MSADQLRSAISISYSNLAGVAAGTVSARAIDRTIALLDAQLERRIAVELDLAAYRAERAA